MTTMKTSAQGIDLIKQFESLALTTYLDAAGKLTVGWGHLVKPGETFTILTPQQADDLLQKDVAWAEQAVNQLVKVPLTQNQFDALVDFTFNLGTGALRSSTLLKRLNEGNYTVAADNFQRWVYAGGNQSAGLVRRRAAEWALFTGKAAA